MELVYSVDELATLFEEKLEFTEGESVKLATFILQPAGIKPPRIEKKELSANAEEIVKKITLSIGKVYVFAQNEENDALELLQKAPKKKIKKLIQNIKNVASGNLLKVKKLKTLLDVGQFGLRKLNTEALMSSFIRDYGAGKSNEQVSVELIIEFLETCGIEETTRDQRTSHGSAGLAKQIE